jgi:5-methylcytosine-specific restriction endonuclease McrBC GTP-binding regulatory subunit McrB
MNDKVNELSTLLEVNKNLILTGAPGTGKTFLARKIAEQLTQGADGYIGFVQFHPSYDYTDFVEGLRPTNANGNVGFKRMNGVFKKFCKEAIEAKSNDTVIRYNTPTIDTLYDQLVEKIATEPTKLKMKANNKYTEELKVTKEGNINWGTINCVSKETVLKLYDEYKSTAALQKAKLDKDGLRKVSSGNTSYSWAVLNYLLEQKEQQDQPAQQKPNFVFIIDEINRGELSKIFGELFFAIDPGYRGVKGKVNTQYQNMIEKNDVFANGFYIPENVYIIGTMNDIDRSVESMDFAIRRRFAWKEIKAADTMDEILKQLPDDTQPETKRRMKALNDAIDKTEGLGTAYHIGAAYFLKLKDYNGDFDKLWNYHLQGLLYEYLRGKRNIDEALSELKKAYDNAANG